MRPLVAQPHRIGDVVVRWDVAHRGWIVHEEQEFSVHVLPMIFNDRVVITPAGSKAYVAGWCYDKGGEAIVAALAWNPRTQDAPTGFKKCAVDERSKVPGWSW